MQQIPRVDQPNEGWKKGIQHAHKCLLLNNTIVMRVVVEYKCFNCEGKEGSCEKHPQHVLKREAELEWGLGCVLLVEADMVAEVSQNKLIEKGDYDYWKVPQKYSSVVNCLVMSRVMIIVLYCLFNKSRFSFEDVK